MSQESGSGRVSASKALILRAAAGGASKDESVSREHWTILRDAAALLLRMR
jgi:hypothetical protein